jgi:hypothetical protein
MNSMINERNILSVFGLRLSPRNIVTARQMVASLKRLNLPNTIERATVHLLSLLLSMNE